MGKVKQILGTLTPERVKNFRVIALCIFAAASFWFLNSLNDNYSTTLRYPIEFVYDTDKYIAVKSPPEEIQINLSGIGWNLFRNNLGIKTTPIQFRLDNPIEVKRLPGSTLLGTITDQLTEFEVNFILTDTLFLDFDRKIEKAFALAIDSANLQLEDNYWVVGKISHNPDSITLLGPETILNSFADTLWVRIPQNEIDESFNEDVPVEVKSSNLISRNPPTVSVSFEVEEYVTARREIGIQPINFPEDSSIYPAKEVAIIEYQIGFDDQEAINDESFAIEADLNKANPEDSTVTLGLVTKTALVRNAKIDSASVKIIFNER